ncbi:hypothetical protein M0805_000581, partial [Coniferiporia weirii]
MSFFGRSSGGAPPSNAPNSYSRLPPNAPGYGMPPPNAPRPGRVPPPPRPEDLYEKRPYEHSASPYERHGGAAASGGGFTVVSCPSDTLALTNRIILHPQAGFRDGDHILLKDSFPLTVKLDNTGKLQRHEIGASSTQRQWAGL